ncbi:MAG TPA: cyclic pyranopterin monophosphate synthase MoaC [Actinomycetota bacterium]|nr:cyclic pyranopterin monophosphate synthase MoaC [Actinomycetota bacterium]
MGDPARPAGDAAEAAGAADDPGRPVDAARMVEVGAKDVTEREATAECVVTMTPEACRRLVEGTPKGDPIEAARVAGLLGAKRTPDLLPFCHPVAVTGAEVVVEPDPAAGTIRVRTTVRARDRTGVEMEALTAAAVAALSLYDTAKAYDRAAVISGLRLLEKRGGKSGHYVAR